MSAQKLTCHPPAAFPHHLRVETLPSVASGKWQVACSKWQSEHLSGNCLQLRLNLIFLVAAACSAFSFNLLGPFLLARFSLLTSCFDLLLAYNFRCSAFDF